MSMNLHCEEVELWQTPTYITNMCYSKEDGGWEGIRYRYIEWVKSHRNGVWENYEKYEDMCEHVKGHLAELTSYEKLIFFVG